MNLPRWVELLGETSDFDPDGDWCRLMCTGRQSHPPELLGIVFAHPERGRIWGGLYVHMAEQTTVTGDPIDAQGAAIPADPDDPLRVPSEAAPGSVTFTCPRCDRTPRLTRDDWTRLAEAVPVPGVFDVSEYR